MRKIDKRHGYAYVHRTHRGWILEHRIVAEAAMGKPLPPKAQIHHVASEQKDQNHGSNLVVCEDNAYHRLLHLRQAALDGCGHADWRKCVYCRQYDAPTSMKPHSAKKTQRYYHAACQPRRAVA